MKAIDIKISDLTNLPTVGRQEGMLLGIGSLLSIVIHGTVVAAIACVLSWSMQENVAQPVLLTLNMGASIPTKTDSSPIREPPRRQVRTKDLSRTLPVQPEIKPTPAPQTTTLPSETVIPATNSSEPVASANEADYSARKQDATATPQGVESEQRMAKTYLDGHFTYLRELIHKRLTYPPEAKRRGYVGRVTVSFVILVSGKVTDLAVLSGSGYRILDENVLQTIRGLGRLPKPPVKVQIVVPISYSLD
jgi:protein TonB